MAPYDFELVLPLGIKERIDVKATSGEFQRTLHVSLAELHAMADSATPYLLYRVSEMDEQSATLRISGPMAAFAKKLLSSLAALPAGVSPDGFSIDPGLLNFGPPVSLRLSFNGEA